MTTRGSQHMSSWYVFQLVDCYLRFVLLTYTSTHTTCLIATTRTRWSQMYSNTGSDLAMPNQIGIMYEVMLEMLFSHGLNRGNYGLLRDMLQTVFWRFTAKRLGSWLSTRGSQRVPFKPAACVKTTAGRGSKRSLAAAVTGHGKRRKTNNGQSTSSTCSSSDTKIARPKKLIFDLCRHPNPGIDKLSHKLDGGTDINFDQRVNACEVFVCVCVHVCASSMCVNLKPRVFCVTCECNLWSCGEPFRAPAHSHLCTVYAASSPAGTVTCLGWSHSRI